MTASSAASARFQAYIRLQAAAVALGEEVPIPEIVVIGGQSDGKSSLVEAFLGFRFNFCNVDMATRRPLILQMVNDPDASEPICQFQEEDSKQYGSPMLGAANIADFIKRRTEEHLQEEQAVSSKPIVMKFAYAHCPNLTIIDTPGFVFKAKRGEPENTPEEIKLMVKSLASPSNRLILFVQQSSVNWASLFWLDTIKEVDPTFRRTTIVISKFDKRLKEFEERSDVGKFLSATGFPVDNIHPFFVAIPKDCKNISNVEFRKRISDCDDDVLDKLRRMGFNEKEYGPYIGLACLKNYLQSELGKRYKEAVPTTLASLEQRCTEVSMELEKLNSKLQAAKDVSQLRKSTSAMFFVHSIVTHLRALYQEFDINPTLGQTTDEELRNSGIKSWPGITTSVCPHRSTVKLYGAAAFMRVLEELKCAAFSMKHPKVSRELVARIEYEIRERGEDSVLSETVPEIACAHVKSLFAPLIDTACDRLEFVVRSLFDLAVARNRDEGSQHHIGDMGGNARCLLVIRRSYYTFVKELFNQCKQDMQHIFCFVTRSNFDLPDSLKKVEENVPPEDVEPMTTPTKGKGNESTEACSSDQAAGIQVGKKRDNGMSIDDRPMKRQSSLKARICSVYDFYFVKIQEFLFEGRVRTALRSTFTKQWDDDLFDALSLELLEANDDKIIDIFVGPIDAIQNKQQSLLERKQALVSCLNEFKGISLSCNE